MTRLQRLICLILFATSVVIVVSLESGQSPGLTLAYNSSHGLVIRGTQIPGGEIRVNYREAYCRAGSAYADWVSHTVIKYSIDLASLSEDRQTVMLRDTVSDGVIVTHRITAISNEVRFEINAHNPTDRTSEIHWA